MYLLILGMPLVGSLLSGFYGFRLGYYGSILITITGIVLSLLLAIIVYFEVCLGGTICIIKGPLWFDAGVLMGNWGFIFDSVTCIMLIVVLSISLFVHIYSSTYMYGDPHITRFMSYLSLFTFFMLCLITSDNFFGLFLGWEGVGLASYLLINFWYTWIQANKSAMKAIIVNRIGDFGIIIAIATSFYLFKSLQYGTVFSLIYVFKNCVVNFLGIYFNSIFFLACMLFVGAVGKSAQIGLHTWLPDAMEGPTPVSALIHAATMVTAGVFLIIRCSPIFEYSNDGLLIISIIGGITALFAGSIGLFQYDLKWVIAYSTCSQLGYMVMACGMSGYSVSLFHLMNHAFFKALLFLSAGSVIHALMDEQDMWRMGGLLRLMPLTGLVMLIGSLALTGFPFTAGYYSKDLILELAYSGVLLDGAFCYWMGLLAAFCTAYYSLRAFYMTFLTVTKSYKLVIFNVHEAPVFMAVPLVILSIFSIFIGYITRDMFVGLGTNFWGNGVQILSVESYTWFLDVEYMSASVKMLPIVISFLGIWLAWVLYYNYEKYLLKFIVQGKIIRDFFLFFNKKWFFDIVYNRFLVAPMLIFGYDVVLKKIDRGFIEILGPTGLVRLVQFLANTVSNIQTGFIYHYMTMIVIGVIIVLSIVQLAFFLWFEDLFIAILVISVVYFFIIKYLKK